MRVVYVRTLDLPPKWLWACATDGPYEAIAMVSRYKDTDEPPEFLKEQVEQMLARNIQEQRERARVP